MSETSLDGFREAEGDAPSLAEAVRALDDRVRQAIGRLERIESGEHRAGRMTEELAGRLRDATDDLDVCQAECVRLTDEIVPLRAEHARISLELSEARRALEEARATIRVMEGTRGWKLLVRLRRMRDRVFGRG